MIKNIIFDWSGVIKDAVLGHFCVVNKILKKFGVGEITLEEMRENWVQPYMSFYKKYIPGITLEEEQQAYEKIILSSPKGEPYSTMPELVRKFKRKGVKMVVISSDLLETLLPEIKRFGLEDVFDEVFANKHDKTESASWALKKYGFDPQETIFIGDSNHEIEVGKKLGIKTGAVTWGFETKEKLNNLKPDYLIQNLNELNEIILGDEE